MKKLLLYLPVIVLLMLPFVSAAEVTIDSYDIGSQSTDYSSIAAVHPSSTAAVSGISQSFRCRYDGANLSVIQIYGYQSSANNMFLVAKIEGHTGTWGSTGVPNGTVLATSATVNVTAWAGSYQLINFTFASGLILDSWDTYTLCIYGSSGSDWSTNNIGVDATNPINHWGNFAAYSLSAWTATAVRDLVFYIYGDGGDLVAWNVGGTTVTINEITETTNVTAEITATNNFNNTAVSAGDVTANGAVTVSGAVTNNFNNTAVTASGDITAGAVTAGDVTASGTVTFGGDLTVNGTFTNATLTYATSSAVSGDANVYFLIAFIALAVLLTFYNKVPLMNFLVGIVGISFITLSFANTELPFWPYSSVLLALVSLLCMISGGFKMRNN